MHISRAIVIFDGNIGSNLAEEAKSTGIVMDSFDVMSDTMQTIINNAVGPSIKDFRYNNRKKQLLKKDQSLKVFYEADIIIESTEESLIYKIGLFKFLDQVCSPKTIFATNSFHFNLMKIAIETKRPANVVGLHIDPRGDVVEIIRNMATNHDAVQIIKDFALSLDKKVMEFEDYPTNIVHKIIMPLINEAVYCLMQGVSNAEEIDNFMRLGASLPIGPLSLADLIGLDECLALLNRLYENSGDYKYKPCPLFERYVRSKWLGCKTGRGFHKYDDNS